MKRNIKRRKQKSNEDLELAALQIFCIYVVISNSSQNSGVKGKYSSLITLEVHPFYVCARMHTCSKFCHAWQHTCNTSLETVHRLAVILNLPTVTKCGTQSRIFIVGDNRKSQGVRYGEYGGCGMNVICLSAKNCCTVSCVTWGIVAVQVPSIMLFFWSFSPHFDPHT